MSQVEEPRLANPPQSLTKDNFLIRRGNEQFGPFSIDQVHQYLTSGSILKTDLAWTTGMSEWVLVSSLLSKPPADVYYVSKNGSVIGPYTIDQMRELINSGNISYVDLALSAGSNEWVPISMLLKVELWNPDHCGLWSLFLTPIFGAVLVSKNWKTLGEHKKARAAMAWIFPGIALILVLTLTAPFLGSAIDKSPFAGLSLLLLFFWFGLSQYPQTKYIKQRLNNKYVTKSEGGPVGIAIGIILLWILLLFFYIFAVSMFLGIS